MTIDRSNVNDYMLLRMKDSLGPLADLEELRQVVESLLAKGQARIAVAFTPDSYLDSRAIGNLARCIEMVRARGGRLAIVEPNPEIADFLRIVGFLKHVDICNDEAEIGRA